MIFMVLCEVPFTVERPDEDKSSYFILSLSQGQSGGKERDKNPFEQSNQVASGHTHMHTQARTDTHKKNITVSQKIGILWNFIEDIR